MPKAKYPATTFMHGIIKVLNLVKNKTSNPNDTRDAIVKLKSSLQEDSTLKKISPEELESYKRIIRAAMEEDGLDPNDVDIDGW